MIKIAVSIPAYGGKLDVGHAGTWLSFGHALAANEGTHELVLWGHTDCNPVADARNVAVEGALAAGADWLLMLDADTYHEGPEDDIPTGGYQLLDMISTGQRLHELSAKSPGAFTRLGEMSQPEGDVALIGAGVLSRGWNPPRRTVWMAGPPFTGQFGGSDGCDMRTVTPLEVADEKDYADRVVECARIGGACVAVNLNWLRRAWPQPPWFFHARYDEGEHRRRLHAIGEDVAFCDGVRQRGGRIYVDGRFKPKHVMRAERK